MHLCSLFLFFFFQAEDGIRDGHVTGVQTCALPISPFTVAGRRRRGGIFSAPCTESTHHLYRHPSPTYGSVTYDCVRKPVPQSSGGLMPHARSSDSEPAAPVEQPSGAILGAAQPASGATQPTSGATQPVAGAEEPDLGTAGPAKLPPVE